MLNEQHILPVGGLTPLTTVDWPTKLAAVVFSRGCPWRCPYCHNKDLQRISGERYDWDKVLGFLNTRTRLLDGVVFSGGEPCMHRGLATAMAEVRALGFQVALHTGGGYPARLESILQAGLVDWVGFDLKAPLHDRAAYARITGRADSAASVARSLDILVNSGVPYELRTTVYQAELGDRQLDRLADEIAHAGAHNLVLQACLEDPQARPSESQELSQAAQRLSKVVGPVAVRI